MVLFSIMMLFVLVLPAAASDSGFTSWTEDLEYILKLNNPNYAGYWLSQPNSGYKCEKAENNNYLCEQQGYEDSHFTCEIVLKYDDQYVRELSAKCVTEEKINIPEYFDKLDETVDSVQDSFIPLYGLKVSEEDWDLIVKQIYQWNRKMPKFSYWLIDDNVIFSSYKSGKDNTEFNLTIIPVGYFLGNRG